MFSMWKENVCDKLGVVSPHSRAEHNFGIGRVQSLCRVFQLMLSPQSWKGLTLMKSFSMVSVFTRVAAIGEDRI